MATFYDGAPEIQADGPLQTLYLMNPSNVSSYSDRSATASPAAHHTNIIFLNSPLNSLNAIPHHHHRQHTPQQHFLGIPLQPPNEPNRPQPMQAAAAADYNSWAPAPPPSTISAVGPGRHQGLSLSLSPQQQQQAPRFGPYRAEQQEESMAAAAAMCPGDKAKTNGVAGLQSVLIGSKYLKAAQHLLDEVVSVQKGRSEMTTTKKEKELSSKSAMKIGEGKDLEGDEGSDGSGGGKNASDLSTAERQELQTKKAKLVNMLDEVEQRYRQYHHQMQMVISSFEAVAGFGSVWTYTALALQTISRQFRCLRDAISGQIRTTSKSLGEDGGSKSSVGSRLRFVDHHLRQHLGMIHHNAWRPQRGLPERAVSVLRAWLFEHFLHPYPKDSDKHMLAKQTGLTRSQVSNWFINARVRLWKPMVEEMYLEETKEQEQNNGNNKKGEDNKTSESEASEHSAPKSTSQQQANISTSSRTEHNANQHNPKPPPQQQTPVHASDLDMFDNSDDEKARSDKSMALHQNAIQNQMDMEMKQDELSNRDLLMKFMDQGAGFRAYGPIGEIGQFDRHEQFAPRFRGNVVSLTLGLPHCETGSLSGSQHPSYISSESMQLGMRHELSSEENNYFSLNNSSSNGTHAPNAYESINIQCRKRFAAQLPPDFVA